MGAKPKADKKPKDMMIRRVEKRSVLWDLTMAEVTSKATLLVRAMRDLSELEDAEAKRRRQAKATIELKQRDVSLLAQQIREGKEARETECHVEIDLAANRIVVRTSWSEEENRALTGPERDLELSRLTEAERRAQMRLPAVAVRDPEPAAPSAGGGTTEGPDLRRVARDGAVIRRWCGRCEHRHEVATVDENGTPIVVIPCAVPGCGCEAWGDPKYVASEERCATCSHGYLPKGKRVKKGTPLHSRESGVCGCGCEGHIPIVERDENGDPIFIPSEERNPSVEAG